jgi:hypothetical protein
MILAKTTYKDGKMLGIDKNHEITIDGTGEDILSELSALAYAVTKETELPEDAITRAVAFGISKGIFERNLNTALADEDPKSKFKKMFGDLLEE